jgi:hypothetical protein
MFFIVRPNAYVTFAAAAGCQPIVARVLAIAEILAR